MIACTYHGSSFTEANRFKPKIIHKLEVGDDARRLDFCLEIGARLTVDMHFHKSIIFSDESTFSINGMVSSQNCRFWPQEIRLFQLLLRSQNFKKVNVWCAITFNRIIGPYFF
ncbi:hypothetical protein NQ318_011219 [Aromia moschata]|uniref:Uncharacterized protein n=1 Tax=Aromia moschata TaxID=1265417 RepID=A0AAV8Y3K6_9CUCU|nr:hypothetical protein NQ318_011219 [Aromia moschata]